MSTAKTVSPISEAERASRRRAVDRARHSSVMEGGGSSRQAREAQEAYVRGDIEVDELVAKAQRG